MEVGEDIADTVKVAVDKGHAIQIGRQTLPGGVDGGLIPVDADEPPARSQAADDLQRVTGTAQRTVHIDAVRPDGQRVQTFVKENGLVAVVLFVDVVTHGLQPHFRHGLLQRAGGERLVLDGGPALGAPDLGAVEAAHHHDLLGQSRILPQLGGDEDAALRVRLAVRCVGEQGAELFTSL